MATPTCCGNGATRVVTGLRSAERCLRMRWRASRGREVRHPLTRADWGYGVTELTDVPQFALPSLVPPQVPMVRVNCGGAQFGYWMYSLAK